MNYTVIAYRESGEDTCRGCVMDRWDSGFDMRTFVDTDRAAEWASQFYYQNKIELGSYSLSYLVNGKPLDYFNFDGECDDEYYETTYNQYDIDNEARRIASEKHEVFKAKKEADRLAAIKRQLDYKVEQDLALFAKLKAQYGE